MFELYCTDNLYHLQVGRPDCPPGSACPPRWQEASCQGVARWCLPRSLPQLPLLQQPDRGGAPGICQHCWIPGRCQCCRLPWIPLLLTKQQGAVGQVFIWQPFWHLPYLLSFIHKVNPSHQVGSSKFKQFGTIREILDHCHKVAPLFAWFIILSGLILPHIVVADWRKRLHTELVTHTCWS